MTTQDKPAVGPLSAEDVPLLVKGDLLWFGPGETMAIFVRLYEGVIVWQPRPLHMDRHNKPGAFHFIGRPDADGWISWSGGENPVPGQMVEVKIRWRDGEPSEGAVLSDHMDWRHRGVRRGESGDIVAFRLAPAAPVEASGSEIDARLNSVKSLLEKVVGPTSSVRIYEHEAKLILSALRPQPSGETLQSLAQAFEDAMEGSHGAWAVSGDEGQPSGETREAVARVEEFVGAIHGLIRQEGRTLDPADLRTILALLRPAAPDGGGWRTDFENAPRDGSVILVGYDDAIAKKAGLFANKDRVYEARRAQAAEARADRLAILGKRLSERLCEALERAYVTDAEWVKTEYPNGVSEKLVIDAALQDQPK